MLYTHIFSNCVYTVRRRIIITTHNSSACITHITLFIYVFLKYIIKNVFVSRVTALLCSDGSVLDKNILLLCVVI